ncbi:MAG: hypothetical protein GY823_10140 [Flavobacteriaceae bacterium]|nr:hypothetical protein [Flavobacteriaceae bacterium]
MMAKTINKDLVENCPNEFVLESFIELAQSKRKSNNKSGLEGLMFLL